MLLKTEDRNCDSRTAGMIGVFEVEEFTRGVIYICLRQMDSRLSFTGKTKTINVHAPHSPNPSHIPSLP